MASETARERGLEGLDLTAFARIVRVEGSLAVAESDWARVRRSFDYLSGMAAKQVVYGINTGFGPMAQHAVSAADQFALQYNLVPPALAMTSPRRPSAP